VKVHDVSLVMRAGMPTWPGEEGPKITPLRRIAKGDSSWEEMVPPQVAELIRKRGFFGCRIILISQHQGR